VADTIGGYTAQNVERMLLDADQYQATLLDVAKKVREATRFEKAQELVRKQLDKQTGKLEQSQKELNRSMERSSLRTTALGHAMGNVLTSAIGMAKSAMADMIRTGLEWEDLVGDNEQAVLRLADATGKLISALALARAENRLHQGDLKLNAEEMEAIGKAAIVLGRNLHIGFEEALSRITDTVLKASPRGLRELGLQMDLTGSTAQKQVKILAELKERFQDVNTAAQNTNERWAQMKNEWEVASGRTGDSFLGVLTDVWEATKRQIPAIVEYNAWMELHKATVDDVRQSYAEMHAQELLAFGAMKKASAAAQVAAERGIYTAKGGGGRGATVDLSGGLMGELRGKAGKAQRARASAPDTFNEDQARLAREGIQAGNLWIDSMLRQAEEKRRLIALDAEHAAMLRRIADAHDAAAQAAKRDSEQHAYFKSLIDASTARTKEMELALYSVQWDVAQQGLQGIVQGLQASIVGGQNFGQVLLQLGASMGMQVASMAVPHIIKETGLAIEAQAMATNPFLAPLWPLFAAEAAQHWAAVGVWSGIGAAGLAGGIGFGLAGNAAAGGRGGGGAGRGGGSPGGLGGYQPSAPAQDKEAPKFKIVYQSTPGGDPLIESLIKRQLKIIVQEDD